MTALLKSNHKKRVRVKVDKMYLKYYPNDSVYTKTHNKNEASLIEYETALAIKEAMINVELENVK